MMRASAACLWLQAAGHVLRLAPLVGIEFPSQASGIADSPTLPGPAPLHVETVTVLSVSSKVCVPSKPHDLRGEREAQQLSTDKHLGVLCIGPRVVHVQPECLNGPSTRQNRRTE